MDERLEKIARAVFNLGPAQSLHGVAYKDHPRWDSLGHIQLILALEKEFRVKFTSEEVVSIRDLGDIAALLRARRGQGS